MMASGLVTRRDTAHIMAPENATATNRSASCVQVSAVARARWLCACAFATSSADSATATSVACRATELPTVGEAHIDRLAGDDALIAAMRWSA